MATFVGLLLPLFASQENDATGRRLFWSGLAIAFASAFFIAYPPDWRSGLGLSAFVAAMMLSTAFFATPYLKVGGKVFAFFTIDAESETRTSNDGPGANREVVPRSQQECLHRRASCGGSWCPQWPYAFSTSSGMSSPGRTHGSRSRWPS